MMQHLAKAFASISVGVLLALSAIGLSQSFGLSVAHAQEDTTTTTTGQLGADDILPSSFGDSTGLGQSDIQTTVGNIIRDVLMLLGIVAVCIVLMGGFKWMTAGGNEEKVSEAKHLLLAGVIGLAIILSAWAISSFVVTSLVTAIQ